MAVPVALRCIPRTDNNFNPVDSTRAAGCRCCHKGNQPKAAGGVLAVRLIEGWIVLVTNVHGEASEESKYGEIHLNLD